MLHSTVYVLIHVLRMSNCKCRIFNEDARNENTHQEPRCWWKKEKRCNSILLSDSRTYQTTSYLNQCTKGMPYKIVRILLFACYILVYQTNLVDFETISNLADFKLFLHIDRCQYRFCFVFGVLISAGKFKFHQ